MHVVRYQNESIGCCCCGRTPGAGSGAEPFSMLKKSSSNGSAFLAKMPAELPELGVGLMLVVERPAIAEGVEWGMADADAGRTDALGGAELFDWKSAKGALLNW